MDYRQGPRKGRSSNRAEIMDAAFSVMVDMGVAPYDAVPQLIAAAAPPIISRGILRYFLFNICW